MKTENINQFIIDNHKTMTIVEMSDKLQNEHNLIAGYCEVARRCRELRIKPVSNSKKKAKFIKETMEELTYQEIGEALGMTRGAVKTFVSRERRRRNIKPFYREEPYNNPYKDKYKELDQYILTNYDNMTTAQLIEGFKQKGGKADIDLIHRRCISLGIKPITLREFRTAYIWKNYERKTVEQMSIELSAGKEAIRNIMRNMGVNPPQFTKT